MVVFGDGLATFIVDVAEIYSRIGISVIKRLLKKLFGG